MTRYRAETYRARRHRPPEYIAIRHRSGSDNRLLNLIGAREDLLDLAQFDPVTAQLDLIVGAAEMLQTDRRFASGPGLRSI